MILSSLLPVFAIAVLFFVLILELADLTPNLYRYLSAGVAPGTIARIALLYLPTCVIFAVPVALLFAVAHTMGTCYARNELIAIFGSGVSLRRLVAPLALLGALLSGALFLFEDAVAIDTLRLKNRLHRTALDLSLPLDNFNVTITSADRSVVYHAGSYDDERAELTDVLVIQRAPDGGVAMRLDAERARWEEDRWRFENVRRFSRSGGDGNGRGNGPAAMEEEHRESYSAAAFAEGPDAFRRGNREVNEMRYRDALAWVETLRRAGRDYRAALTESYGKLSFAATPLAVTLIAAAVGGLMRRNIVLMSMLLALAIAVVFYVLRLVGGILAQLGVLSPEAGAFGALLLFLLAGVTLLQVART